jgi:hypothetical protein
MSKRGRPSLAPDTLSEPLTVRLPVPVYDALLTRATELRMPVRDVVRQAISVLINRVPPAPSAQ